MTKKIHEILDIDDIGEEIEDADIEVDDDEVTDLVLGGSVPATDEGPDAEDVQLEQDFKDSVETIKDVIVMAREAAEKVATIAADTEDDKDYNELNALLKTIVDASDKTVGLYNRKVDYKEKKRKLKIPLNMQTPVSGGMHIDKAIFTGTLDSLIDNIQGEKEKGD